MLVTASGPGRNVWCFWIYLKVHGFVYTCSYVAIRMTGCCSRLQLYLKVHGFVYTSSYVAICMTGCLFSCLATHCVCPKFGFLLHFFAIVTARCFNCYLIVCFYRVFILLTWSLWQLVQLVGLVIRLEVIPASTIVVKGPRFRLSICAARRLLRLLLLVISLCFMCSSSFRNECGSLWGGECVLALTWWVGSEM